MPVQLHTQLEPQLTVKAQGERLRIPFKGNGSWFGKVLCLVDLHDETDRLHEEIDRRQVSLLDKACEASIGLQLRLDSLKG